MDKKIGYIYIATNKTNGKQYVGQTRRSVEERIKKHLREDTYFANTLRKYGLDNFRIWKIVYAQKDLSCWEEYFIKKLNTIRPSGYNLTNGGESPKWCEYSKKKMSDTRIRKGLAKGNKNPMFNRQHTEEAKRKQKESKMGEKNPMFGRYGEKNPNWRKHPSEETRKKMRENHADFSGENHPNYGNYWTDEQKQAMSEKLKGRFAGKNNPNYGNHQPHTEEHKIKISESLHRFYSTPKGKEKRKEWGEKRKGENNPRAREVVLISPDGVSHRMKSYTSFCESEGLIATAMAAVMKGKRKHHHGWKAEYII